jgi:hypothetical protein
METELEDDLAAALVNDKTAACSRADVLRWLHTACRAGDRRGETGGRCGLAQRGPAGAAFP